MPAQGSAASKDKGVEVADNADNPGVSTYEVEAINKPADRGTVCSSIRSETSSKRNNGEETATKASSQDNVVSGTKRARSSGNSLPLTLQPPKKQKTNTASAAIPKSTSNDNVKVVPYELLLRMRRTPIDGTDDKRAARDATRWIVTLGKDHGAEDGSIAKQYLSRSENRETYNRNIDEMLECFKSCLGGASAGWISGEEMM
jgi:hypothetical protein